MIYIIVPTYNEKHSLPLLTKEIISVCQKNSIKAKIIVIDDNSPDTTGTVAKELKEQYPELLQVYHRKEKQGLGSALRLGFSKALQEETDFIIQLDADLSHNPRSIPRFLKAASNCDLVLGSRYIQDGKIVNWNFMRRLISRFGTLYARKMLNLPYQDLTTGYRCIRTSCLRKIAIDSIETDGYGFQIELAYRFHLAGLKVVEIPIEFTERRSGKSKFSKKIAGEAFWKVIKLRKLMTNDQ